MIFYILDDWLSGFTYRGYEAGDEHSIVPLLVEAFNGWPKIDLSCSPLEHWKWKYLDNPFSMSLSSVALHGDKIVGVACQFPTKMKIGEKWLMGAYAADLGVYKHFRNRGISKKLVKQNIIQLQKNKINKVYFVTSNPYLIQSYTRDYEHSQFPYRIANMIRIRDINKHLKHLPVKRPSLIKIGYQILKNYYGVKKLIQEKYSENSATNMVDNELSSTLNKVMKENSHYKFILDKSSKFLQWRFSDQRAGSYSINYYNDEAGSGYIVVGVNRINRNYPVGYIVDLLATPKRNNIVNYLVKKTLEYLDGLNINTVSCLITKNHPYEKVLNRHGFLDSRVKLHLFMITYKNNIEKTDLIVNYSPKEIHFTYAGIDSLPAETPEYAFY